jgi:hypothetical protein
MISETAPDLTGSTGIHRPATAGLATGTVRDIRELDVTLDGRAPSTASRRSAMIAASNRGGDLSE